MLQYIVSHNELCFEDYVVKIIHADGRRDASPPLHGSGSSSRLTRAIMPLMGSIMA